MKVGPLLLGLAGVLLGGCSRASVEVAEREVVIQVKDDYVSLPDRGDCLKKLPRLSPDSDNARLAIPLAHFRKAGPCQLSLDATAADNLELSIDVPAKRADVAFARCKTTVRDAEKQFIAAAKPGTTFSSMETTVRR